ncbi:MAG: glycosyltransferase [Qipengyuania sp.]
MLSAWASRANGGVFEAVAAQAAMLRDLGAQPVVFAVQDEHAAEDAWKLGGAETHLLDGSGPSKLSFAPKMGESLLAANLDCLHLHGVWNLTVRGAGHWQRRSGRPLVVSPHGMFDPWIAARNPQRKWLARLGWERRAWKRAALFHALTEAEAGDVRREVPAAPVRIVPNSAPPRGPERHAMPRPNLLYLGRIHPKKNLDALLAAWRAIRPRLPENASLTLAGWGEPEHLAQFRSLIPEAEHAVEFVGPAFGAQKAALFDIARFLVLPSFSEGLPMVVIEAWAQGTPAIISKHCHLPEGYEVCAAHPCATNAEGIAHAILKAMTIDEPQWLGMSRAAQALAGGLFSRETVSHQWGDIYSRLLGCESGSTRTHGNRAVPGPGRSHSVST